MADALPDDDATRIYRPYGSPPPDASATGGTESRPDPFAADPPAPDPFAADPFAPHPASSRADAAPDPFAPDPPARPAPPDPFAPDPFAPDPLVPGDASSGTGRSDPFASPPPASTSDELAADPFRPPPPTERDPFASPSPPPTPDPFATPAASPSSDPFAAPAAAPPTDPFATPPASPAPAPAAASPFDLSAPDPFAAPPPLPALDPVPARASDPFTTPAATDTDDPFADLQGAGGGPSYADDSRVYAAGPSAGVDLPDVFGTERTLAGAFTPVFSLILQIRASDHLGDPTALRQRVETLLSESARSARELGVSEADLAEAEFGLVAFLDEAILGSDWPGRDAWSAQPLQLTHYDRYDAGERFFDRLKALFDEGGTRTAVLEVYYLCLALGFKGRYAIQGREVLRRLVDDLHGRLERVSGEAGALAPRGTSREVPAEAEKGGLPSWALWTGAAVLVALLYLGLSLSLSGVAEETAADLEALTASSPPPSMP